MKNRTSRSLALLFTTAFVALSSSLAHSATVEYFDCSGHLGSAKLGVTTFTLDESSGLVSMTRSDAPAYNEVLRALQTREPNKTLFVGDNFHLVIHQDPRLPTQTFLGHITAQTKQSNFDLNVVCELKRYEKPEPIPPGGISVHN